MGMQCFHVESNQLVRAAMFCEAPNNVSIVAMFQSISSGSESGNTICT